MFPVFPAFGKKIVKFLVKIPWRFGEQDWRTIHLHIKYLVGNYLPILSQTGRELSQIFWKAFLPSSISQLINIAVKIRLICSLWEKNCPVWRVIWLIFEPRPFFGIAMILKSGNGHLSKTFEAHMSVVKNYFSLNRYFQSVSNFNMILRFKKYGISYSFVPNCRVGGGSNTIRPKRVWTSPISLFTLRKSVWETKFPVTCTICLTLTKFPWWGVEI